MKSIVRIIVVTAALGPGLLGLSAAQAATPTYSAGCAQVDISNAQPNSIDYNVTNTCGVVRMNAIVARGDSTGCLTYNPHETKRFYTTGDAPEVTDVVYC